jgi:hypothetical protein
VFGYPIAAAARSGCGSLVQTDYQCLNKNKNKYQVNKPRHGEVKRSSIVFLIFELNTYSACFLFLPMAVYVPPRGVRGGYITYFSNLCLLNHTERKLTFNGPWEFN